MGELTTRSADAVQIALLCLSKKVVLGGLSMPLIETKERKYQIGQIRPAGKRKNSRLFHTDRKRSRVRRVQKRSRFIDELRESVGRIELNASLGSTLIMREQNISIWEQRGEEMRKKGEPTSTPSTRREFSIVSLPPPKLREVPDASQTELWTASRAAARFEHPCWREASVET